MLINENSNDISLIENQESPSYSPESQIRAYNVESRKQLVTTVIILYSYIVAIFVPNLDEVLAFVGATGGVFVCFILPSIFYLKLTKEHDGFGRTLCIMLGGLGAITGAIQLCYMIFFS